MLAFKLPRGFKTMVHAVEETSIGIEKAWIQVMPTHLLVWVNVEDIEVYREHISRRK